MQGSPQGNSILVFPRRYIRRVEAVFISLVDPWQTYDYFPLYTSTPFNPRLCSGIGQKRLMVCSFLLSLSHRLSLSPSSGIIEDILAQHQAGSAIITYFYCDFRDEDEQNCRNLVLSIISQLCAQSNLCCDALSRTYSTHGDGKRKPIDETLTRCLTEMVSLLGSSPHLHHRGCPRCPNNSGMPTPREEVLDLVKNLVGLRIPNLHICVTSRPEIDIQSALEPLTSLRVSLHHQSGQMRILRRWREEDRNLVIETLSEKADGMSTSLPISNHSLVHTTRQIFDSLPGAKRES